MLGAADADLDPFSLERDGLRITAREAPTRLRPRIDGYAFVTGVITTRRSFAQRYGYFEARLRAATGVGLLSAFWLMPVRGWPPEIDVVEVRGEEPRRVYQTVHAPGGEWRQVVSDSVDAGAAFHAYGVLWTPRAIETFVDGVRTGSLPNVSDQPMYMLADLDVGDEGAWEGQPASSTLPASLRLASVRAYVDEGMSCFEHVTIPTGAHSSR